MYLPVSMANEWQLILNLPIAVRRWGGSSKKAPPMEAINRNFIHQLTSTTQSTTLLVLVSIHTPSETGKGLVTVLLIVLCDASLIPHALGSYPDLSPERSACRNCEFTPRAHEYAESTQY